MNATALDAHLKFTKDFVAERVAETSGDPGMAAMAVFLDKTGAISVFGIHNSYMENADTKDNLAVELRKQARKREAAAMLFISEMWTQTMTASAGTRFDEEEARRLMKHAPSLRGQPGTKDMVMIQEVRGGNVSLHAADIIGTQPRTIGDWTLWNEGGKFIGRFVDDIIPVIRENYQRYVN